MSFPNRIVHLTCEDSGVTVRLINCHQYNPVLLSLPNICTYHPQFKYNLFSPILSNCIPRCLFPLVVKSYWVRIKHAGNVERNLTGGYMDWKIFLKSQFVSITSRTGWNLSWAVGSFLLIQWVMEAPRRDDCELNHEAVTSFLMFHVRLSVPYHRGFLIARGRCVWSSSLLLKRKL